VDFPVHVAMLAYLRRCVQFGAASITWDGPTARFSRRRLDESTLPTARPGGRLEPRVGPWQLPLPAGAEDCHDWEKMQSSAAQRPGSAAAPPP
jgi:hypothetical protein